MIEARDEGDLCDGAAPEKLDVVDAMDLLAAPLGEPKFLVSPLLPEASLVLLSGDTGSGKTAFAVHIAAALAVGRPVAGRFEVSEGCRPVLFLNGEMSTSLVRRYLREALLGLDAQLEPGRFLFEGLDGVSKFHFSGVTKEQLEGLVADWRPSLVIIDTQRAILIDDENDGVVVRAVFSWLRERIVNAYGATVLVCHHLRKIGQASNTERERVSGSRDILASVDVHLAAKSQGEHPMHALAIGKTRFPADGIAAGTEWPIEARLEYGAPGEPNRSIFIAGEIGESAVPVGLRGDDARTALLALFEASGGPLSRGDANAKDGNAKRAWDSLAKEKTIVFVGKDRRKKLFDLAERAAEAVQLGAKAEPLPEPATRKALQRKGLNRVRGRTGSEPRGKPEATVDAPPEGAATLEPCEPVHGSTPIGEPELEPLRFATVTAPSESVHGSVRTGSEPEPEPRAPIFAPTPRVAAETNYHTAREATRTKPTAARDARASESCGFPIGLDRAACGRCGWPWSAHVGLERCLP